jgi:hypothetical protein
VFVHSIRFLVVQAKKRGICAFGLDFEKAEETSEEVRPKRFKIELFLV